MRHAALAVAAFFLCLSTGDVASAAPCGEEIGGTFEIGAFLGVWNQGFDPLDMTPDGSLIAFVERTIPFGDCKAGDQRLAVIRPDGTGYRVVLDTAALTSLWPTQKKTLITQLRISGDGKTIAFSWPHKFGGSSGCDFVLPAHLYLVDVETSVVSEVPAPYPLGVSTPSFSDDGSRISYAAVDNVGATHCFIADKTASALFASDVQEFLSPGAEGSTFIGRLTGNGENFVYLAFPTYFLPAPGDVYLHRFRSGTSTKITPSPRMELDGVSASFDGHRIVYGIDGGPVYQFEMGDLTPKVLVPMAKYGTQTISRDGEWVYFSAADPAFPSEAEKTWRIRWDGTGLQQVSVFWWTTSLVDALAISADGSLYAFRPAGLWWLPEKPLSVVNFALPALTVSGTEAEGTELTCEIGGQPGSAWLLAMSLGSTAIRMPPYGKLQVDPSSAVVLATGAIPDPGPTKYEPPHNTAVFEMMLPSGAGLVGRSVTFQSLVMSPGSAGGKLTNAPVVVVSQ